MYNEHRDIRRGCVAEYFLSALLHFAEFLR